MIIKGIVALFFGWIESMFGAFPHWTEPTWLASLPNYASTLGGYLSGFSYVLPVHAVYVVVNGLLAVVSLCVSIKVGMKLVSLFTGGGGAG